MGTCGPFSTKLKVPTQIETISPLTTSNAHVYSTDPRAWSIWYLIVLTRLMIKRLSNSSKTTSQTSVKAVHLSSPTRTLKLAVQSLRVESLRVISLCWMISVTSMRVQLQPYLYKQLLRRRLRSDLSLLTWSKQKHQKPCKDLSHRWLRQQERRKLLRELAHRLSQAPYRSVHRQQLVWVKRPK